MSYSESPSRADAVFRTLVALYGAGRVSREFGSTPPGEWNSLLGSLKDYELTRGIRRLTHSGKSHVPSMPEFLRLCREIGGDDNAEENRKPLQITHDDGIDGWEVEANRHLLAHVWKLAHAKHHVTEADTRLLVTGKKAWACDMREAEANNTMPADNGAGMFREYMQAAEQQFQKAA